MGSSRVSLHHPPHGVPRCTPRAQKISISRGVRVQAGPSLLTRSLLVLLRYRPSSSPSRTRHSCSRSGTPRTAANSSVRIVAGARHALAVLDSSWRRQPFPVPSAVPRRLAARSSTNRASSPTASFPYSNAGERRLDRTSVRVRGRGGLIAGRGRDPAGTPAARRERGTMSHLASGGKASDDPSSTCRRKRAGADAIERTRAGASRVSPRSRQRSPFARAEATAGPGPSSDGRGRSRGASSSDA
jgi:hypothetical protein